MRIPHVSRRKSLIYFGAAATGLVAGSARATGLMTMYKNPTCGCCSKWAARMREAGFTVEEAITADMAAIKARLGVPAALQSCHTAEIDGHVVEGHAPADAIRLMLSEHPEFSGLAAPGMPIGSPGMEGGEAEVYPLYLFDAASSRAFGNWRGAKPA